MVTLDAVRQLLRRHPYFAAITEELDDLLAAGHIRELAADETLFMQDERGAELHVVLSGTLQGVRFSADGRHYILATFGPGETLAEVPAWDGGRYPSAVIAAEPASVFVLPRQRFRRLVLDNPQVAEALIDHLTTKLRYTTKLAEDLALRPIIARVARVLLHDRRIAGDSSYTEMTQEELAGRVGSVRQVVGRALSRLEEDGLIERGRGRITILDARNIRRWIETDGG